MRAPPEVEEVYRGVAAPSRKAVTEEATVGDMPKARLIALQCCAHKGKCECSSLSFLTHGH